MSPGSTTTIAFHPKGQEISEAVESAQTFHFFPQLPTELRLKIWEHALPDPRVVELEFGGIWWSPLESAHTTSGLLSANHESREVILGSWLPLCHYGPSSCPQIDPEFSPTYYYDENADMSAFPVCYLNPSIDTVYLGPSTGVQFRDLRGRDYPRYQRATYSFESIVSLASIAGISGLRFLAVDEVEWHGEGGKDTEILVPLAKLERFEIVLGDVNYAHMERLAKGGRKESERMAVTLWEISGEGKRDLKLREQKEEAERMFGAWNGEGPVREWGAKVGVKCVLRGGKEPGELVGVR